MGGAVLKNWSIILVWTLLMERDMLEDDQKLRINFINPDEHNGAFSGSREQCPEQGCDG